MYQFLSPLYLRFTGTNSTPRLVIALVSHTHEGKWQCEATNSIGTSQGTMMSVDVKRELSILPHCIVMNKIIYNGKMWG